MKLSSWHQLSELSEPLAASSVKDRSLTSVLFHAHVSGDEVVLRAPRRIAHNIKKTTAPAAKYAAGMWQQVRVIESVKSCEFKLSLPW